MSISTISETGPNISVRSFSFGSEKLTFFEMLTDKVIRMAPFAGTSSIADDAKANLVPLMQECKLPSHVNLIINCQAKIDIDSSMNAHCTEIEVIITRRGKKIKFIFGIIEYYRMAQQLQSNSFKSATCRWNVFFSDRIFIVQRKSGIDFECCRIDGNSSSSYLRFYQNKSHP